MDKGLKLKYVVDAVMAFTILITAITGIINMFILVLDAESRNSFLGIAPSSWLIVHAIFGVTSVLLIIFHLFLHKDWIVFSSKNIFNKKKQ